MHWLLFTILISVLATEGNNFVAIVVAVSIKSPFCLYIVLIANNLIQMGNDTSVGNRIMWLTLQQQEVD